MIDELRILQEIVGDLSGLGGWLVAAYLSYKIILIGVFLYGFNVLVKAVSSYLKADITKAECVAVAREANDIKNEKVRREADHYAETSKLNAEIERVKHMYKILKEAQEHKDES